MDERYLVCFEDAYRRLTGESADAAVVATTELAGQRLTEALAEAEGTLTALTGRRLRADARLWLYLNLLYMVIVPVSTARPERLDDLFDTLAGDLRKVLSRAAASEAHTELSAYRVMATLSMAWEQLAIPGGKF
jgi:hypothetical protein